MYWYEPEDVLVWAAKHSLNQSYAVACQNQAIKYGPLAPVMLGTIPKPEYLKLGNEGIKKPQIQLSEHI